MSEQINPKITSLIDNIEKVVVGKRETIELLITGILAKGHVLIKDIPGVGKTTIAKALSKSISADFKRIQFTPDLLPTDITGVSIYNQNSREFEFKPGPVFSNILLADEINRTTPRTQSSLLECMQEFHVTVDGKTYELPKFFIVLATQNPIEFHGTYPLPEAQVDRFLLELSLGYPTKKQEEEMLTNRLTADPIDSLSSVMTLDELLLLREQAEKVFIEPTVITYITDIIAATRELNLDVKLGCSPRSSIALMKASKAFAFLRGRDYVLPSDIKSLAPAVLKHRIVLQPRAIAKGLTPTQVIQYALSKVTVPTRQDT